MKSEDQVMEQFGELCDYLKAKGHVKWLNFVRGLFKDNVVLWAEIEKLKAGGLNEQGTENTRIETGGDTGDGTRLGSNEHHVERHGDPQDSTAPTHVGQGEG